MAIVVKTALHVIAELLTRYGMKIKLIRAKEAADTLGLKPCSMRVLEKHGLIQSTRDWSGHRRFEESAVLKLREQLLAGKLRVEADT